MNVTTNSVAEVNLAAPVNLLADWVSAYVNAVYMATFSLRSYAVRLQ